MSRAALVTGISKAAIGPVDPLAFARRLRAPIWVYDIDNCRIAYANDTACRLWQAETEAELQSRDMGRDLSITVAKRLEQYQSDFTHRDATFNEMWTLYPNGEPVSVMVIYCGFRLPDGRMAMQCEVIGHAEDAPQNLRSAEALLHTDVMITLFAETGPPLYMNPAARNALVHPDQPLSAIFVDPQDYTELCYQLDRAGEHRKVALVKTGEGRRWLDLSAKSCLDAATGQNAILVTAIDVSALKTARDQARYLAERDQLTGCYNREFLRRRIEELARTQARAACAIVFFDVDRFKQINDLFGHEMGDRVLQKVAARTFSNLGPDEIAARLGGDEFVVLMHNLTGEDDLMCRAEKLRLSICQPVLQDAWRLDVTVSIGATLFAPDAVQFTDVMREADIALYASKVGGRNRSTLFDVRMGAAAKARDQIEYDLKSALANREFVLHYQPRVELGTGRVVSVEGLVRWQHPRHGLLMPDTFVPICEETGMIEEIGRQVLDIGAAQAIAWREAGVDLGLSLNISPRQFSDLGMMTSLQTMSKAPGFENGKIELEITENALIGDPGKIADKLRAIHDMGYCIAIDDFGTGYSNLSYIARFPLDCLKIDKSFIADLPNSAPIIRLILTLAQQSGLTSVAEGVETQAQSDWLAEHGCDQIQGYLFSPPVPADALVPFLYQGNCLGHENGD